MVKKLNGKLVYSTDALKMERIARGGDSAQVDELPPEQTTVRVSLDRKRRRGKTVTVLTGFQAPTERLKQLGRKLKTACGSGGTVRANEIEIQGDHRDKICTILKEMNYIVKRIG